MQKYITYSEACLGTKIEVESLDGKKFIVKVVPGTTCDSKLRIKGLGLPSGPSGNRGDLYVKMGVQVPKELSEEQEKLIMDLQEIGL